MTSFPRPKKRFGQNFLTDQHYASKIVELVSLQTSDTVVEIGPGRGVITRLIAEKGCRVIALEIDRNLVPGLSDQFKDAVNVSILNIDALDFDFRGLASEAGGRIKIVANLPYNVATSILFKLLDFREDIDSMALMFQKEVAERITAPSGGKDYGALSIFPQLYADITIEFKLPPGAFFPAPKVTSAVLFFDLLENPRYDVKDGQLLREIVKCAFSQRRKKLSNSLKSLFPDGETLRKVFGKAGIDQSRRAETLSVEEFCRLSNVIKLASQR